MRPLLVALSTALLASTALAQDAVAPRKYKLQQPGLVEQMRQMKPIEQTRLNPTQANIIAEQLMRCWKPSHMTVEKNIAVDLQIQYNPDGTPGNIALGAENARLMQDAAFLEAVKSAMDAVRQCSPLQGVQHIPYEQWQHFELVFAPSADGTQSQ